MSGRIKPRPLDHVIARGFLIGWTPVVLETLIFLISPMKILGVIEVRIVFEGREAMKQRSE